MRFFSDIRRIWNEHGFEILFIVCVLFILVCSFFQKKGQGTWSKYYFNPFEGRRKGGRETYEYETENETPSTNVKKDSTGETVCRQYLERRFRMPFNKARPDFLKNPVTGGDYNLELDCYNPQLRLGLEYNGAQHYKYIPYFHRNKEAFLNQKYRDEMKRVKCMQKGIRLIEVPYSVKPQDIPSFIDRELLRFGYR
jgi:hypothetical protein